MTRGDSRKRGSPFGFLWAWGCQERSLIAEAFGAETGAGGRLGEADAQRVMRTWDVGTRGAECGGRRRGTGNAKTRDAERGDVRGSCLGLPLCLLVRAASRPQRALRARDRLLARAVSLDPARTSKPGAWCRRRVSRRRKGTPCCVSTRLFWRCYGSCGPSCGALRRGTGTWRASCGAAVSPSRSTGRRHVQPRRQPRCAVSHGAGVGAGDARVLGGCGGVRLCGVG